MAFTYFFRDVQTLELIRRRVLPVIRGHRYINLWDAGCAHGPEPYSIAIVLRERMSHMLFRNVRIYATDIDTCDQFGQIISEGIYPEGQIKRIPAETADLFQQVTEGYVFKKVEIGACKALEKGRFQVNRL